MSCVGTQVMGGRPGVSTDKSVPLRCHLWPSLVCTGPMGLMSLGDNAALLHSNQSESVLHYPNAGEQTKAEGQQGAVWLWWSVGRWPIVLR